MGKSAEKLTPDPDHFRRVTSSWRVGMARKGKRSTPEEIVGKLRQVEVLAGQGKPVSEAVWTCLGKVESCF